MTNTDSQRILDKALRNFLMQKNNSLYASVLFVMDFRFSDDPHIETLGTDYKDVLINEKWFLSIPPKTRECAIAHEMEHILRLHNVRQGNRDPSIWNEACDFVINLNLYKLGYTWEGFTPLFDPELDPDMTEEDLYDKLAAENKPRQPNPMGACAICKDKGISSEQQKVNAINTLNKIVQHHKSHSPNGSSTTERLLNEYINPKVPWHKYFHKYLTKYGDKKLNWKRRNRRFRNVFIPSYKEYRNKLIDINYYVDVSGSITQKEFDQVASEIYEVKKKYNPENLNIIAFDTQITQEFTIKSSDGFSKFSLLGGGGTNFNCVYDHIVKTKPTVAIIFSDLCGNPIPDPKIDVIWIRLGNWGFNPTFGKVFQYE